MTKTKIRLQCPGCAEKFYALTPNPECCPHCGYEYDVPDNTVVSLPALRGANSKAMDQTYRDLERSSELRAQQAADMLGVPASEMASMKITNMRDNVKEGESYAAPTTVSAPMQQTMTVLQQRNLAGATSSEIGQHFAASVNHGFAPRSGARTLQSIQRNLFVK